MGTPDFAVESLKEILKSNHNIVGVVTATDKPAGRGKKMMQSAVKTFAIEHELPLFQPEKLKSKAFIAEVENINPDVIVVVAFRYLPKVIWSIPKLGTFNLHASLLPDYRGAAPINYAVMNGEKESGVTTFLIDENIDTGNVLLQEKIAILETDSAGDLHDKLMNVGSDLVIKTLDGLANNQITPKPQINDSQKLAYKIFKEDCEINWNQSVKKVYDFIRGLSPFPTAFTRIEIQNSEKGLKIFEGKYEEVTHSKDNGEIEITNKEVKIYCLDGIYFPTQLQLEGKKRMNVSDFCNGIANKEEVRLIY